MSAGDTSERGLTRKGSAIQYRSGGEVKQADVGSLVDRFRSVEAPHSPNGENRLPETDLPGFGERYPDCGDDIPRFCSECGATHSVGRTCKRSTCPRCGAAWARDRATSAAAKLEALRRYKEAQTDGWSGYKFHHLTLSPPEGYETFSEKPLDRTFDLLKEVLEEIGASTGVIFYHPYRGENGDDRGAWKERLFTGREWGEVRSELAHSPHFHAVVLGQHIDGGYVTRAIEEQTGWLVERITKGESNVSIYDKYDLGRVLTYCLSHTGVRETEGGSHRAMYRYYGKLSNFAATEGIKREMDAAVRSVAPRTLGLSYDSLSCSEERSGEPVGEVVAGISAAHGGSGDGDGDGMAAPVDETEEPDYRCSGRLLEISKAPAFLNDREWMEQAARSEELVTAWMEWEERDHPPPTFEKTGPPG
jgi:hypothetical protein